MSIVARSNSYRCKDAAAAHSPQLGFPEFFTKSGRHAYGRFQSRCWRNLLADDCALRLASGLIRGKGKAMHSPSVPIHAQSPTGLAGLFEQHRSELGRFLAARCGSADDAQDLLQDLWIKLETGTTGPVANGRAYLFRMANNLVLDRARARQRSMHRDREWIESGTSAGTAAQDRPDPVPAADEALAQAQEAELVETAIAALPPGAQRALRLCRIDGMGQSEAAQVMGISRSGVEKHLAVAMKLLRKHFVACGLLGPAASGQTERSGDRKPSEEPA